MATVTRQAIREYMIDVYGLGRRGIHDGGAVTTPADDSQFGGPGGAEDIDNGCELLITSGTRDGDLGKVSKKPSISGGVITTDPPPGGNLANADTFEVLYRRLRFERIHADIDRALLEYIPEKLLLPVTSVKDGDMLLSTYADWTTYDSNAASSKIAAKFPYGLRELFVDNSGANGYTHSGAIAVEAGGSYYLEATVRAVSGTAKLILYDETNSAAITLNDDDSTEAEPTILYQNAVTIPSTCYSVSVRLGGTGATDDTYWSNVILRKNSALEFTVQDRAEIDRLGRLFATSDMEWAERGDRMQEVAHHLEQRTEGLWVYRLDSSVAGCSLWYEEFAKRSALTADTSTTSVPKEEVAAVAAWLLLEPLSTHKEWYFKYQKAARAAAVVLGKHASQRSYVSQAPKYHVLPRV